MAFDVRLSSNSGTVHKDVYRVKLLEDVGDFFPICYITEDGDKVLPKNHLHLFQLGFVDIDAVHAGI